LRSGVRIDGASSDVTVSRTQFFGEAGSGLKTESGAQHVTVTTNEVGMQAGTGISLTGTANADVTSNSVNMNGGTAVGLAGGTSAVVENNMLEANGGWSLSCPTGAAALAVDSSSAATVHTGYNALNAEKPSTEYSWAGTAYASAAAFGAAGQGAHDVDLTRPQTSHPPAEGSPLIDAADRGAPGELSTDVSGNPHVDDPEVADTGSGACHADRELTSGRMP
jgi:hypothetical protein